MVHTRGNRKRKVVLIGIDAIMPGIIDKIISMGGLPTIRRIIEKGCYSSAEGYYPLETGTNWATIATGASPYVHGCKYWVHIPGKDLLSPKSGFSSRMCNAEQIWQCFDKQNLVSVIFDYPQSLPLNIKRVIHLGEDGCPEPSSREISAACGYSNNKNIKPTPFTSFLNIAKAKGWNALPFSHQPPLEAKIVVNPKNSQGKEEKVDFFLLILDSDGQGYNQVQLYSQKEKNKLLAKANLNEWSNWTNFVFIVNGKEIKTAFRFKLLELASDGSRLRVYFSQIYPQQNFVYPSNICKELSEKCGPYLHRPTAQQVVQAGACDIETFYEESKQQAGWYGKAAKYILGKYDWNFFTMKWHGPDFMQHICMHMIDPIHPLHNSDQIDYGWKYFAKYYQLADNLIADVISQLDEEATIGIVSDHGHIANIWYPGREEFFVKKGLTVLNPDGTINWKKTKAIVTHSGIYVNLKGREPFGIVQPGKEYEKVRDEIIEVALSLREPTTGRHAFNLVARKEDLQFMGIGGERAADVIFCLQPFGLGKTLTSEEYRKSVAGGMWGMSTGTHGPYLPSTKFSVGGMESLFILSGPKVKKGYRRKTPIKLTQVAPTLCHLANIPRPSNSEESVIYDFLLK